ncbi:hypothetical protein [Pararobbsia silviterrae]|uniref:hypothetical protein n=1 Tax=Pararobbsia silviterrae TaxID=1792498 RepID=UPI0011C46C33|nr:hypothetical protein [Pararobbsia silviterrae]
MNVSLAICCANGTSFDEAEGCWNAVSFIEPDGKRRRAFADDCCDERERKPPQLSIVRGDRYDESFAVFAGSGSSMRSTRDMEGARYLLLGV